MRRIPPPPARTKAASKEATPRGSRKRGQSPKGQVRAEAASGKGWPHVHGSDAQRCPKPPHPRRSSGLGSVTKGGPEPRARVAPRGHVQPPASSWGYYWLLEPWGPCPPPPGCCLCRHPHGPPEPHPPRRVGSAWHCSPRATSATSVQTVPPRARHTKARWWL